MLRRIGFAAAATLAATVALSGFTPAYAAHKASSAVQTQCGFSSSSVGAPLVLSGSGYSSGASYSVDFVWPGTAGSGGTAAIADSSGDISVFGYAYWPGTYSATVMSGGKVVATCSTTVG